MAKRTNTSQVSKQAQAVSATITALLQDIDNLNRKYSARIPGLAGALAVVVTKVKTIGGGGFSKKYQIFDVAKPPKRTVNRF
jgi:hypothetical protein